MRGHGVMCADALEAFLLCQPLSATKTVDVLRVVEAI